MESRTQAKYLSFAFAALATAALLLSGCSSGIATNSSTVSPATITGPAFVVGTDAPMASVTSFAVQVAAVNAIDASGNSVPLLSGTPTVDFARYNGLQTLLDMNDVPVGTYSSVSIVLGPATIGYLNTTAGGAPTIATEAGTYPSSATTYTYKATLTNPLVVTKAGTPVGLRVDFNLAKSIVVDSTGAITGQVTPVFNVSTVGTGDAGGYIDTLKAAVVSINTSAQSFVVQGPHGQQFTINVDAQTEWDNSESLSALTTSSIVEVSGILDKADSTLDADEVAIVSQDGFYTDGQITYVQPPTGAATSFDLYVRSLLPANTGITLGQIAQVNVTGSEKYFIYWMHNALTRFLFNQSQLLAGQPVAVGGPASGAANAQAVTVKRIELRNWGFNGTVVANSVNATTGTFQMQINGFAGVLVPQTVTVYLGGKSEFRNGLSGMSSVTGGTDIRVVGLLLKDPTSGQTVLIGRYVDEQP
jgi:hypothetical protein